MQEYEIDVNNVLNSPSFNASLQLIGGGINLLKDVDNALTSSTDLNDVIFDLENGEVTFTHETIDDSRSSSSEEDDEEEEENDSTDMILAKYKYIIKLIYTGKNGSVETVYDKVNTLIIPPWFYQHLTQGLEKIWVQ